MFISSLTHSRIGPCDNGILATEVPALQNMQSGAVGIKPLGQLPWVWTLLLGKG